MVPVYTEQGAYLIFRHVRGELATVAVVNSVHEGCQSLHGRGHACAESGFELRVERRVRDSYGSETLAFLGTSGDT